MQKRKFNKEPKIPSFDDYDDDDSELPDIFFEDIEKDLGAEHSAIGGMVQSIITTSVELSKLVIENRLRNSEQMIDEDIYKIYSNSFKSILKTSSGADE